MKSILLGFWCCIAAVAQTTGTISGTVTDPAGSIVPNASVTLKEIQTQAVRRVATGADGSYLASGLAPGGYEIRVEVDGFRVSDRRNINLEAGRSLRVDVELVIGARTEAVVVEDEAPLVSPTIGDWGTAVSQQRLSDLPLNGRDVFELAAREPGAVIPPTQQRTIFYGGANHMSINGARPTQNTYLVDGIFANDATGSAGSGVFGQTLGLEAVAELRLVSSPFLAEYGRVAGGTFIAVSRSGGNRFHGSAFEFWRNSALNAKNFFDAANSSIPPLKRNQFGGLVSGPIVRNRLFFLASYEGVRNSSSATSIATTLDSNAREGILPSGRIAVSASVAPFLNLYPLPNNTLFGDGTGQYIAQLPTVGHENYTTGKIDYIRSEALRFGARYSLDTGVSSTPDPYLLWSFGSQSASSLAQVDAQYVPSPSTVHNFRAGFSRVDNNYAASQTSRIPAGLNFSPDAGLGVLIVNGLTDVGGQMLRLLPFRYLTNDYQENWDVSRVTGGHSIKAGAGVERLQFNPISGLDALGYYQFSSVASLISGSPASGQIELPGSSLERGWRQTLFYGYIQDEFQLLPRLRISLGLRYEPYSTPTEVNGLVGALPDPLHDTKVTLGAGVYRNPSKLNLAPRAAVAWDLFGHGRTVFRAGAGIFYDMLSSRDLIYAGSRMPPFYNRASLTLPPFPNLAAAARAPSAVSVDGLQYYENQPYVIQMQTAVEQLIGKHMLIRVGYAGNRGIHLPGYVGAINVPVPSSLPDGRIYFSPTAPLLNPSFSRIGMRFTRFPSNANALQLHAGQSLSHGLRWQANYTFSKVIDLSSNPNQKEQLNDDYMPFPLDFRENRGRASFDVGRVFSADWSWETNRFLGRWQFDAIFQAQSGPGFNPIIGFDRAGLRDNISLTVGQRPNLVAGVPLVLGDPARWFNPLAFTLPDAGTYGNLGRNTLPGPGLINLDFAVHKVLWSRESTQVTLRGEFFNIANHPNFAIPSSVNLFSSSGARIGSAGQITQTTTPSRQVQVALKVTF